MTNCFTETLAEVTLKELTLAKTDALKRIIMGAFNNGVKRAATKCIASFGNIFNDSLCHKNEGDLLLSIVKQSWIFMVAFMVLREASVFLHLWTRTPKSLSSVS